MTSLEYPFGRRFDTWIRRQPVFVRSAVAVLILAFVAVGFMILAIPLVVRWLYRRITRRANR